MLSALSWDPGFRGLLVVAVGVIVLGGSTYLLLATNTGARLGFLLALTALAGWMAIMGLVWAIYGIGYQGRTATWEVEEVNFDDLTQAQTVVARTVPPRDTLPDARSLIAGNATLESQFPDDPTLRQPQIGDLLSADPELEDDPDLEAAITTDDGWKLLAAGDSQTGEAVAAASAYVVDERSLFASSADFVVLDTWSEGGKSDRKSDSAFGRVAFKLERIATLPLGHPTHSAVVRLQAVVPREQVAGQPPPTPVADADAPIVSVVMIRDLGSRRQPAIFVTLFSMIVFAVCANSLHRRDKLVREARAAAVAAGS